MTESLQREREKRRLISVLAILYLVIIPALGLLHTIISPNNVAADDCLQMAWDTGPIISGTSYSAANLVIYPNWVRTQVAAFQLWMQDPVNSDPYFGAGGATETIRGITVVNFGTASSSNFSRVYMELYCGATAATLTLSYAGIYNLDSGNLPAWTWSGVSPNFAGCPDLCGGAYQCGAYLNADIFIDVVPCPTAGATVQMGFDSKNWAGAVTDNLFHWDAAYLMWVCNSGPGQTMGSQYAIQYVYKEGPTKVIPGDTVEFSIYYGRPGAGPNVGPIRIYDSLPPYTHYVDGSATPDPLPGWAPDPGPPMHLMWEFPTPVSVTGGPTDRIVFSLSIDWGNTEAFEPGSGDIAAPEGAVLANRAHGTFMNSACSSIVSNTTTTSVRRFLMWLIGDNDVLFSQTLGQSADEITFSIFIKNISDSKTWWNVTLWDTVPTQLNAWAADCGFEDPCVGWTMTPTGCAFASPGVVKSGANTILTWKLDMPPYSTWAMRWKATVKGTAAAGDTAINVLSLFAGGRPGVVNGTGSSVRVLNFAHLAPIILPTTYISYVAYSGDQWGEIDDAVTMFPLNKKAQFELRGLKYAAGWATASGVSASIGCLLGDCLGGFPGNPAVCGNSAITSGASSTPGCKAERIPARFHQVMPKTDAVPYQHLYKITANCPVNWQSQPANGSQCGDFMTYAPATTLSFTGLIHYFWKNSYNATYENSGTEMFFINTGKDPYGSVDTTLPTTVHEFKFNYGTNEWDYLKTYDLGPESGACDMGTLLGQEGPYRSISSQAQLIVWQGYQSLSTLNCGCPCYDNSVLMPTRETGNVVGFAGQTFYGVSQGYGCETKVSLGNVGASTATYKVYQYVPDSFNGTAIPFNMRGEAGHWMYKGSGMVPAGLATAGNPRVYNLEGTLFDASSTACFKVEVESGGPIQIFHGARVFAGWGGGAVINSIDGGQTGTEFWLHTIYTDGTVGTSPETYAVDVFCSKSGTAVRFENEDLSRVEIYTTNGPDQCIAFRGINNPTKTEVSINYRAFRVGGTVDLITQYINAGSEKGYTAPFLQTGVHYAIILPTVVYSGQPFWITVVVLQSGGATKTDYNGVTSFSGTDPNSKIENQGMAGYDYTWQGTEGGVKMFFQVTLTNLGLQSIVAVDTQDGSISGIAATMVVGADVKLLKEPKLTIASSGERIQFRICWSNYSSATATEFVITDAIPMGMSYVPEAASLMFCGAGGPVNPTVTVAYGTASATTPATFNTLTSPTQTAPSNTRWLRWTVRDVYVFSTGCVCFRGLVE